VSVQPPAIATTGPPLLEFEAVQLSYRQPGGRLTRAVDDLSLGIAPGEVLGLAGESGSGKSSLARSALGLLQPSAGRVLFDGRDLKSLTPAQWQDARRRMQIVFQDPSSALSPRRSIRQTLQEPLRLFRLARPQDEQELMAASLAEVGLSADCLPRYPHQFSSGQRQRIALARALICRPDLLIADEAVAALDVSVQAQILELLQHLRGQRPLSILFISHDLAVLRQLADSVAVMYRGRLVEQAPAGRFFAGPQHPYARALLASMPGMASDPAAAVTAGGGISRARPEGGCVYRDRCPLVQDRCQTHYPSSRTVPGQAGHRVECHLVGAAGQDRA